MGKTRTRKTITLPLQDGSEIKLTAQQAGFCQFVAREGNASEAYRQNYNYDGPHARQEAYKLISGSEDIQKAIEHYENECKEILDVSFERVLGEYAAMAFSNAASLFDENMRLKPLTELGIAEQRAIKKVKVRREFNHGTEEMDDIFEIEFHDKKGNLDKVAQLSGHLDDEEENKTAPINLTLNINGEKLKPNAADSG